MTPLELRRHLRWLLIHYGPPRDVTVETGGGTFTFLSNQWLPGKYLYVKRSYEEQEITTVMHVLKSQGYVPEHGGPARTVLNIGANIGMTCVGLLKHRYFDRAIAIEPAPDNFRLLLRNIAQNGFADRIFPLQLAVSSSTGWIDMELSPDNPGDHRVRQTAVPGFYKEEQRQTIPVRAEALDDLAADDARLAPSSTHLAWIDIQGHEGQLFKGARQFFACGVPAVSEFWPYGIARSGVSPHEYCQLLAALFDSFFLLDAAPVQPRPIAALPQLFERFHGPRAIGLLVLVPRHKRHG